MIVPLSYQHVSCRYHCVTKYKYRLYVNIEIQPLLVFRDISGQSGECLAVALVGAHLWAAGGEDHREAWP